jgi:hypothetical protein
LITTHENISVDFAMAMDARKLISGIMAIENVAGLDPNAITIPTTPSAKTEVVLGQNATGWMLNIQTDIAGLSTLMNEIN